MFGPIVLTSLIVLAVTLDFRHLLSTAPDVRKAFGWFVATTVAGALAIPLTPWAILASVPVGFLLTQRSLAIAARRRRFRIETAIASIPSITEVGWYLEDRVMGLEYPRGVWRLPFTLMASTCTAVAAVIFFLLSYAHSSPVWAFVGIAVSAYPGLLLGSIHVRGDESRHAQARLSVLAQ